MLWKSLTKNDGDMRKAFNTLDANQDGYISKSELEGRADLVIGMEGIKVS